MVAPAVAELNRIGIALSTERDPERLLNFILTTARDFTASDAGSLYILERDDEGRRPGAADTLWTSPVVTVDTRLGPRADVQGLSLIHI